VARIKNVKKTVFCIYVLRYRKSDAGLRIRRYGRPTLATTWFLVNKNVSKMKKKFLNGRRIWMSVHVGMWGSPSFGAAMFVGMLVATVTSILESIGDYYAAAQACVVPPPPNHAVNRGITVEGLGAMLSGLLGAAHATTSYSTPTAMIRITGVCTVNNFITIVSLELHCVEKMTPLNV